MGGATRCDPAPRILFMTLNGNLMNDQIDISILLPTRARTHTLVKSISSLIDNCETPSKIEWLFGFDDDDVTSSAWCVENVIPLIEQSGGVYKVLSYPPMGYENLHKYVNGLAKFAKGKWFVFWNDDAVMEHAGWDRVILETTDFCIQAFDTHNKHPYSIFPIVPREWYDWLGHLSRHQLNDAYISQIAWMLDIMKRIDVKVTHARFDLTGENKDDTYLRRRVFEGNRFDPRDFNHATQRKFRLDDANIISQRLVEQGKDMSHWYEIRSGKRDPWAKMLESDVNNHMKRLP